MIMVKAKKLHFCPHLAMLSFWLLIFEPWINQHTECSQNVYASVKFYQLFIQIGCFMYQGAINDKKLNHKGCWSTYSPFANLKVTPFTAATISMSPWSKTSNLRVKYSIPREICKLNNLLNNMHEMAQA